MPHVSSAHINEKQPWISLSLLTSSRFESPEQNISICIEFQHLKQGVSWRTAHLDKSATPKAQGAYIINLIHLGRFLLVRNWRPVTYIPKNYLDWPFRNVAVGLAHGIPRGPTRRQRRDTSYLHLR